MPKQNGRRSTQNAKTKTPRESLLSPSSIFSLFLTAVAFVGFLVLLGYFNLAGPAGRFVFRIWHTLWGSTYFLSVIFLFYFGLILWIKNETAFRLRVFLGSLLFFISIIGMIDTFFPNRAGFLGSAIGSIDRVLGAYGSLALFICLNLASFIVTFDRPLRIGFSGTPLSLPSPSAVLQKLTLPSGKKQQGAEGQREVSAEAQPPLFEPAASEKDPAEQKKTSGLREFVFAKKISGRGSRWQLPPLSLLKGERETPTSGDIKTNMLIIKKTLENFGVPVEMDEVNIGPTVTQYTLKPAEGVKLVKILALQNDLALALAAHPIRIEAPIPGKSLVGIEVPNKKVAFVHLRILLETETFLKSATLLTIPIGQSITGEPVYADLGKLPHLLIAGATGSGKSVFIHTVLMSLLIRNTPDTLQLILVDPKRVELFAYHNLPHLLTDPILEARKSIAAMRWLVREMERRYEIFQQARARDIESYNLAHFKRTGELMPYIVLVIDELADLMASFGREVEASIIRLTQMARATGIHLVLATQRPSVDILTGLIKANITNRVAFKVASQVDSRTILDVSGSEKLLGSGDLLYLSSEFGKPKRLQAAYVSNESIQKLVAFWSNQATSLAKEKGGGREPSPPQETPPSSEQPPDSFSSAKEPPLTSPLPFSTSASQPETTASSLKEALQHPEGSTFADDAHDDDELYPRAYDIVVTSKKASASLLQRRLKIGYARAARLLDLLEANGVVGPADGAKPRAILIGTETAFEESGHNGDADTG